MPEKYFEKFQTIQYANTMCTNIMQRSAVVNSVYANPSLYYAYDVQQQERPDQIADRYYKDQYMDWILYLTNSVQDPYHDWYIDQTSLDALIIAKYGSLQIAKRKIKYFRNNWPSDRESITTAEYSALPASLLRFYEPLYYDQLQRSPSGYVRRQEDWVIDTNEIRSYTVANGTPFIADEICQVSFNTGISGTGQVAFANSTTLLLKHLQNQVANTITANSYIYGEQSLANTQMTVQALAQQVIPSVETSYWSPVYCYDYEQEQNEMNKSIRVMDSRYSTQISAELRKVLRK